MILGALATALMTGLAARSAFLAFEGQCAMVDNFIATKVKVKTVESALFDSQPHALVFYTKDERRTWEAFECLLLGLTAQFSERHSLNLRVSKDEFEADCLFLLGAEVIIHQNGSLASVMNSLATCCLKYVHRDFGWLNDPVTIEIQEWLASVLDHEAHFVILNASYLLTQIEGRPSTT